MTLTGTLAPGRRGYRSTAVSMVLAALLSAPALAQDRPASEAPAVPAEEGVPAVPETGPRADQAIGKRFEITPDSLPEPNAGEAVANSSTTVERGDAMPIVPPGFEVTLFASGLANPRQLLALPDGGVILAQQDVGEVTWLKDQDGDGASDAEMTIAAGLEGPYGIVMKENGDLYIADMRGIWVAEGALDSLTAENGPEGLPLTLEPVTDQGVFGEPGGHSTRSLAIDPDTGKMYSGVGSEGNIGVEPEPRATVQVFDADGSNQQTFASGTRNPVGIGFNPTTGKLWITVQERDGLGNRLVPDYFTEVDEGDFFGWPYAYIGSHPQPGFAEKAPDKVAASKVPSLLFEAHSSPMDFVFYQGEQFPDEYRGDAFVTLRGSWNRADPTGYKVVHVPFEDGKPVGGYENFMTGFWVSGDGPAEVWGRPATIAETSDGALLIGDDTGGTIWRVGYAGDTSSQRAEAPSGAASGTAAN